MSLTELPLTKLVMTTAAERSLQRPSKAVVGFVQQDREMAHRLNPLLEELDSELLQVPGIEKLMAEPLASSLAEKLERYHPLQHKEAVHELADRSAEAQTDETEALPRRQRSTSAAQAEPSVGKSAHIADSESRYHRGKGSVECTDESDSGARQTLERSQLTSKSAAAKRLPSDSIKASAPKQAQDTIVAISRTAKIDAEQASRRLAVRADYAGAATAWFTPVTCAEKTSPFTKSLQNNDHRDQDSVERTDERDSGASQTLKRSQLTSKSAAAKRLPSDSIKASARKQPQETIVAIPRTARIDAEQARRRLAARAEYAGAAKAWVAPVTIAEKTSPSTEFLQSTAMTGNEAHKGPGPSYLELQIEDYLRKVPTNLGRYYKETAPENVQIGAATSDAFGIAGIEPLPSDEAGARAKTAAFPPNAPEAGGLRGLAARASGPLELVEVSGPEGEAIARHAISGEPPLSSRTAVPQTEQRKNGTSPSSQTVAMRQVGTVDGNMGAFTQRSLAADIAEVLAEEACRAGIDVEQFRP